MTQRFRRRDALRHARLGLLHADKLARTHPDPVTRADARCTREDFQIALDALYAHKPAQRLLNTRKPPRPKS